MLTKQEAKDISFSDERLKNVLSSVINNKLLTIVVETVSACNLKCVFCDAHSGRAPEFKKHSGLMKNATWKMFVSQLNHYVKKAGKLHMLQFYGNGEPLLDKQLENRIKEIKKNKLCKLTRVISNGVIAKPERIRKLIASGLDELHLSLDIIDRKRYLEIKKRDAAHLVVENINNAISIIEENKKTQLFIKYFKSNNENEYGVKKIDGTKVFKTFYEKAKKSKYVHLKEQPLVTTGLGHLKGDKSYLTPCEVPFYLLYVMHSGKVSACCTDVFSGMTVGNINNKKLYDISIGSELAKIRHLHLKGKCNEIPLCAGCGNRTAVDLLKLNKNDFKKMETSIINNIK